ncbi:uncharacterized protein [Asterias amurensis]|uniref:uncharacterized protein n=1 Tax=Asterias amurensis TaxID=7602 RepID=UPI003AB3D996
MALRGRKRGRSPSSRCPCVVASKLRGGKSSCRRQATKGKRRSSRNLRHREVKTPGSRVKTSGMCLRGKGQKKIDIPKRAAHRNSIRRIRATTRLPWGSTITASTTPRSKSLHASTTPSSKSLHRYNLRSYTSLHKRLNASRVSVGNPARSSPSLKTKLTSKKRTRVGKGRFGPRNVQRRGLRSDIMKDLMSRLIVHSAATSSHLLQEIKPITAKLRPRGIFSNQSPSIMTMVRKLKRCLAATALILCFMCLRNGKMKCAEFTNSWPGERVHCFRS